MFARGMSLDSVESLETCVKGIKISTLLNNEPEAEITAKKIIRFWLNKTKESMKERMPFIQVVKKLLEGCPIEISYFKKSGDITYRTRRDGAWKLYEDEQLDKLGLESKEFAASLPKSKKEQSSFEPARELETVSNPQISGMSKGKGKEASEQYDDGFVQASISAYKELTEIPPTSHGFVRGGNAANNEIEDPRKKIQRYRMVASLQYELFQESGGEQRSKLATALKTLASNVPDAVQETWLSEVNEYFRKNHDHSLSLGESGMRQRSLKNLIDDPTSLIDEAQGEHATARDDDEIRDLAPESSNVSLPISVSSVISSPEGGIPREKSPDGGAQAAQPGKFRPGKGVGPLIQNAPFASQIPPRAPGIDDDSIHHIINNEIRNWGQDGPDKNREAREFLGREQVWDRKSLDACVNRGLQDFSIGLRETGVYEPFYIDKFYALVDFFRDVDAKAADYICDKVVNTDGIDPSRKSCFMMHRVKIAEQEHRISDARSFRIWAGTLVGQEGVPESNRWNVNMEIAKDENIPHDQRRLSAISALSAAENNPKRVLLASQAVADIWRVTESVPVDFEKRHAFNSSMDNLRLCEIEHEREKYAKSAVQCASNPNQLFQAASLAFDLLERNHKNDYYLALAHVLTLGLPSKRSQVNNACRARGINPTSLDDLVKVFTSDSAGQVPGHPEEDKGMSYPSPQQTESLAMSLSSGTSPTIETPTSPSTISEFSYYSGPSHPAGDAPPSQYSFLPVGSVSSLPSTGTWNSSMYGEVSTGLDVERMRRIMSIDKGNWRQHNPDTFHKASEFLQRENIWDENTLHERAKTLLQSFTDCKERGLYDPQFIDKMYALSDVFLNVDTGVPLDAENAARAADTLCEPVAKCSKLDAARKSCFIMQRVRIAAKEDRTENALSLGAAAVKEARRDGVSENHLGDIYRDLIAIPNVGWPKEYKRFAAERAPVRRRWFVNMEAADDDQFAPAHRMLSAVAALHDAKDATERLLASQKVNELWDDKLATPDYPAKKSAYTQVMNLSRSDRDEVNRAEYGKKAVRSALSPQDMFDAAILVVNNANQDDATFVYYLALAHLSTQNERWKKDLVERACVKRGIDATKLDEYVKSYSRGFAGQGYGAREQGQSVHYPPCEQSEASLAIDMGYNAPESSYSPPGPSYDSRLVQPNPGSIRGGSVYRPSFNQPPTAPGAARGQGSSFHGVNSREFASGLRSLQSIPGSSSASPPRNLEFTNVIQRPPGRGNGRGRGRTP